ncbi:hypothetical protein GCM10018952_36740 [Streptosporangium vulgare]
MAAARWTSCDRILPRTGSTIRSAESRPSATVAVSDTRAITPEKNEKMPRMAGCHLDAGRCPPEHEEADHGDRDRDAETDPGGPLVED